MLGERPTQVRSWIAERVDPQLLTDLDAADPAHGVAGAVIPTTYIRYSPDRL